MQMRPGSRWNFSTLRFLGFVTSTCIACALGVAIPSLMILWGLLWFFAAIVFLRFGTARDTFMLVAWAIIGACIVLAVLTSFVQVVWDGRFPLTVVVSQRDNGGAQTELLGAAMCWNEADADCVLQYGSEAGVRFDPPDKLGDDRYTISVPCSGRVGPFGIERWYIQPKFVVIEYSVSIGESPRRKKLEIPSREEARVIHTALP